MAPTAATIEANQPVIEPGFVLPMSRSDWSPSAQRTYREVLGELDAWSRRNDSPRTLNAWIAEEAVRQSW